VGFWSDLKSLAATRGEVERFEPRLDQVERDGLYAEWRRAVERSREWAV
jgi:glycerol kinase